MIRDGSSGTWGGRSGSAAGAAGAPARRAPPPQAATTSNTPHHGTFIGSPSLPRGPTAGGVVRRRTTREPIAKRVGPRGSEGDRKSTRLNSSHSQISYAVFRLKKK